MAQKVRTENIKKSIAGNSKKIALSSNLAPLQDDREYYKRKIT